MWFAQQLTPAVPIFIAQYVTLQGDLDVDLLSRCAVTAAEEFQSPFLHLIDVDGEPYQFIDPDTDTSIEQVDLRDHPDPTAAAHAWMEHDYSVPIDLTRDRLIDMTILQVGDREYLWYTRIHHVALDGYSGMTVANRIAALYTAALEHRDPEPNRALDLRELLAIDQKYRASGRFQADREYWADHIAGIEAGSTLAETDAPVSAVSRLESAPLPEAVITALDSTDRTLEATPAAVLIAAFACYLARMTGRTDVLVNMPVSARTTAPLQRSGGMLVNVAPLRATVLPNDTVADLVGRIQLELMGALRHQRCSIEDIRRDAGLTGTARGLAGPMVNVMLFHQKMTLGDIEGEYHIVTSGPVEDLLVNFFQSGSPTRTFVEFRANPGRYSQEALHTHHRRFLELVEEFVQASADTRVADIHAESSVVGAQLLRTAAQLEFWSRELAGLPDILSLPSDRPRPARRALASDRVDFEIPAAVHRAVVAQSEARGCTVFAAVHAALVVLLARLADVDDVAIGTPVTGRSPAGEFVNTLTLRTRLSPGLTFDDLLTDVCRADTAAFRHAETPFAQLVESLDRTRENAHSPLFQVMLEFLDGRTPHLDEDGLVVRGVDTGPDISALDLRLTVEERFAGNAAGDAVPDGVHASFAFATDMFDPETIETLSARFLRVLDAVLEDPSTVVADIDLLSEEERRQLSGVWGGDGVEPRTLAEILAAAAHTDPTRTALTYEGRQLSYRALDEDSNRLARLLVSRGVGPESVVALSMPRSIESVASVWAVAKTGAAFVPVDPNYPADRIEHMLTDSGATLALTVAAHAAAVADIVPALVVDDPGFGAQVHQWSPDTITDADRSAPVRIDNPAYLIYTSGSTGTPKGVTVTHRGLANFAEDERRRYGVRPDSRTLHFSSPSFDASVLELMLAFGAGATMVIAPPTVYGGAELTALLRDERVTHAFVTPAALGSVDADALPELECVVTGGEACPPYLVEQWAPRHRMFNAYGPTEATVVSSVSDPLVVGQDVTIGCPPIGTGVLVLDARLRPVPPGVAGELYVYGEGLARGYHARAGTTAERFVANPFDGTRMYRTGDLVRWRRFGRRHSLEYVGRTDFQIKIRGYRIELGEVEAALRSHPDVGFALATGFVGPSGDTLLVAYVQAESNRETGVGEHLASEVTAHAADVLPPHMVPASVVVLDSLPLTPAGKLDRRALPEPRFDVGTGEFHAPATLDEKKIAGVFSELLGVERIGTTDSFFDLGGNSLTATRIVARINATLGTELSVLDLFEAPTVGALAARVEAAGPGHGARPPLVPRDHTGPVPVSLAQQRMWFVNQLAPGSAAYNIPIAVRLSGPLDVAALRGALADVVERHQTLRTVFPNTSDGPVQQVRSVADAALDLEPEDVTETQLPQRLQGVATAPFDVSVQLPVRAHLWRLGPTEHVLALVAHHVAADGLSMAPLARDVMVAYGARAAGTEPAWPPLAVQYADYAVWQRELLGAEDDPRSLAARQIAFWRDELTGAPDLLELPTDRPRPPQQSMRGGTVSCTIAPHLHRRLLEVAGEYEASLFMVLHAALAVLLARASGATDVTIGSPVSGRGEAELDDLVGMFVNTLVLRSRVDHGGTFSDLLAHTRTTDLAALGNTDVPFERLVEVLDPPRSEAYSPLFQVMLVLQGSERNRLELPGLAVEVDEIDTGTAKFDLQVILTEQSDEEGRPGPIEATLSYATDLFDPDTVAALAERYLRILEAVSVDPAVRVGDIDVLVDGERELVLDEWNATAHSVPDATLTDLFDAQARRTPHAVALTFGDEQLTYAEFASRARRLARELIARGVGPESRVALSMRRSFDLLIGMYAVTEAGGAYVPLDPDHPAARTEYVLASAAPACVLTTRRDRAGLQTDIDVLEIDSLDLAGRGDGPIRPEERVGALRPDHVAYVIYTSGSTGRPKGVAVSHRAIVNRLAWMQDPYHLTGTDVVVQKTPATFDVSVWEFFWPLQNGASLAIALPEGHRDPAYLSQLIHDRGVTVAHFVPSMLAAFIVGADPVQCRSLRTVFCSGEALPPSTAEAFAEFVGPAGAELHNLYGPTEAAVDVTYRQYTAADTVSVPIGTPVWNTQVYVLDARLHPAPVGVPGELYLAGVQLARGYVGRPDLTAERFVANPFGAPGTRLYRTGDLVRWRKTGHLDYSLDYLGRTDFQVKLRGLRIELGEVEATLLSRPGVAQAVVVVRRDELVGRRSSGTSSPIRASNSSRRHCGSSSPSRCPRTWCRRRSWCSTSSRSARPASWIAGRCRLPNSVPSRPSSWHLVARSRKSSH
ncbi:hypothetical protein RE9416_24140 [Prescottella equi]|nr:hypothetical protein RE9416_24140 [Prescottella equi]